MSKYIDADLYVEMQIYDDEHEEWSIWNGTIEDLLNQWTEEGCPSTIEVSEDCISREYIVKKLKSSKEFYLSAWGSFSNMDDKDKARCDELNNCIATVINAPSVVPTTEQSSKVGDCPHFIDGVWCNLVGKEMKGEKNE